MPEPEAEFLDAETDEERIDPLDVAALAAFVLFIGCAGAAGFLLSVGFAALAVAFLIFALVICRR